MSDFCLFTIFEIYDCNTLMTMGREIGDSAELREELARARFIKSLCGIDCWAERYSHGVVQARSPT